MYSKLLAALVASALSLSAFAAVETDTKDDKDKAERGFFVAGDEKEGDKDKAEIGFLVADNHGDHDHGDAKEGEAKAEEEKPAEEPKKIEYEDPTKYYPKK
jgi:hypothetical protein